MKKYELDARYDSRESFYHKAVVEEDKNGKTLYSYETKVCMLKGGKIKVLNVQSATTRRHIKEFLRQETGKTYSTKELRLMAA